MDWIGRQLIQIASHWGIRPIAIVRRDDLEEELKGLGACHVINSCTDGNAVLPSDKTYSGA